MAKSTASTTVSTATENKKQEDNQVQKGLSEGDSDGAEPTLKRQGTLRRKFNIHRGKQNDGNSHVSLMTLLLCLYCRQAC